MDLGKLGQYKRKDHLYKKAKDEGLRSRASFKLVEIQKRFKLLLSGDNVLDLGCWPGGWIQECLAWIGPKGRVVGIDLVELEAVKDERVHLVVGDIRDDGMPEKLLSFSKGSFDVVLSDMSPKLSGVKEVDQAAMSGLAESALYMCSKVLRKGGSFAVKLFKGADCDEFVRESRKHFEKCTRVELDSTRKTSNEFYLIGSNYLASEIDA